MLWKLKIPKSIGISDKCGLSCAETNKERERKDYEYFTLITQCLTRTLNDNVIIYIFYAFYCIIFTIYETFFEQATVAVGCGFTVLIY